MKPSRHLLLYIALLVCSVPVFAQKLDSTDIYYQTGKVQPLMAHYEADRGNLQRFYVIPNSPERRTRLKAFQEKSLSQLQSLDFSRLTASDKVDYLLFQRRLNRELQQLAIEETEFEKIKKYVPFADSIYQLEKLRRRGAYLPSEAVGKSLANMNTQLRQLTKSVAAEGSMSRALSNRAEMTVRGLQAALKSVNDFYFGYDPAFTWWVANPYKTLDSSLNAYAGLLRTKVAKEDLRKDDGSGIIGNPIGREELIKQLQYEMIPYSPEDLVEIAAKEFAWCDAEMLKASREMGFGDNWKAALEKVKNNHVPAGRQPDMLMDLYNQSVSFLKKHDLLTIPPLAEETWRMTMMTPERQLVAPFFLGGETLLISYPTNTMDHESKMMSLRGNNPHFSRAVLHHELIAGHGLQAYMTNRYKAYRNFNSSFWSEGWALYWEMILWDKGFPRNAEDKVGMLFWRMHRCARIIFSLNYHLGKWTPQQCIDFLIDRVGHEKANAEGEVRRSFTGGYGPLYQLAYMIGALQFYALKTEVVDSGKMSFKQFHDAVLRENSMPVEMVRAIITNLPLQKDYKTSWKFYKK